MTALIITSLVLSSVTAGLFLLNLLVYRRLPKVAPDRTSALPAISVLIPARNEAANIHAAVKSILANTGVEFEVIVMDDASTDSTAEIVRSMAARDGRVALASAPALKPGWCGKTHACQALSALAKHSILLFLDADVRLADDALRRIAQEFSMGRVSFLSGVPRQKTLTFSERLLIPLIHFVLLGYLPIHLARRFRRAAFAAGCGQLVAVKADAYHQVGGHAAIKASLHDGLLLARAFRRSGCMTGLFDATDVAVCRMYRTNAQVWRGLEKNATEGIGAAGTILPMTALMLVGQVLPWLLLPMAWFTAPHLAPYAAAAVALSLLPRIAGWLVFRQPLDSVLLHPLGIVCLLGIQWVARCRKWRGFASTWKGRDYGDAVGHQPAAPRWGIARVAKLTALAALVTLALVWAARGQSETKVTAFELPDQFSNTHSFDASKHAISMITVADRKGHEEIRPWVEAMRKRYGNALLIEGVANVTGVPATFRPLVRKQLRKTTYPIMMDWQGAVVRQFGATENTANIYLLNRKGEVLHHATGEPTQEALQKIFNVLGAQGLKPLASGFPGS